MVASAFVFVFVFDLMFLPFVSMIANAPNDGTVEPKMDILLRIGVVALFVLFGYIAFRAARAVYRWDARRGQKGLCETQIEVAKLNLRWRNTWICTSCGGKTVVVE
jgi:hypothetical protein